MKLFWINLVMIFKANSTIFHKYLNLNPNARSLRSTINDFIGRNKTNILKESTMLEVSLQKIVIDTNQHKYHRAYLIYQLLDLFPKNRTSQYIDLFVEVANHTWNTVGFSEISKFGIEIEKLKGLYIERYKNKKYYAFATFKQFFPFEFENTHIEQYARWYIFGSKEDRLTLDQFGQFLIDCPDARKNKAVVEEYIYRREIELTDAKLKFYKDGPQKENGSVLNNAILLSLVCGSYSDN